MSRREWHEARPGRRARLGVRARVVALLLGLGVLAGVGTGGVLALWSDEETVTGRLPVGVAVFGAGAPDAPVYADSATWDAATGRSTGTLTIDIDAVHVGTLYGGNEGGAIAVPIRVDSLAQGHRGLRYELDVRGVAGELFEASSVSTHRVADPAACVAGLETAPATGSTPWTSEYSDSSEVLLEHWCIVARYVPTTCQHENTVTVTASHPVAGEPELEASDSWQAHAERDYDPAAEHVRLELEFTTFPAGDPWDAP